MEYEVRREAKTKAKEILKGNFLQIIFYGLMLSVPTMLLSGFYYINSSNTLLTTMDIDSFEMVIFNLQTEIVYLAMTILVGMALYPLRVGVMQMYVLFSKGEKRKFSDVFLTYSSGRSVFACYATMFNIFWRTILVFICYFLAIVIALIPVFVGLDVLSFILIPTIFVVFIYKIIKLSLLETLSMGKIYDDEYTVSKGNKMLKQAFKGGRISMFIFPITFAGWAIISSLLSSFTLGIANVIFGAYYTISLWNYINTKIENVEFRGEF